MTHPRASAVIGSVVTGFLGFLLGRAAVEPINIGLAALMGCARGARWLLPMRRQNR